jgi:4-hydroxybenzoate polyprenyltransferase/phosphoserine phosphatase
MPGLSELEVVAAASEHGAEPAPPFVVDLDGTLIKTDLLLESVLALMKQAPWIVFLLPFWLSQGRARFKQQVARRVALDADTLPYRGELVDYLKSQRAQGRTIVLATAANAALAESVARHLKVFDLVFSSDGKTNLCGASKRDVLVKAFGEKGFDYAGNGMTDFPVWASARQAIAVNPGRRVRARISGLMQASCILEDSGAGWAEHVKALRPHHWTKNLLLFVPLLAAHRLNELALVGKLLLAFVSFVCVASSTYLVNDLFDLAADRHHPHKRLRPFASGNLSLGYALAAIPVLFVLGMATGAFVSLLFLAAAMTYFVLSLSYSLRVRKVAVLDVIFLAGLYTLRILAGSAAVEVWPSHWLLALSTFLFFSMALVKRYGELAIMRRADGDGAKARGYELSDAELLASMGIASGYLGVLVLALYINSDKAPVLYGRYQLMWFLCPLLLYWISHMWLVAHRGRMPDDPVVFALHDRVSWILVGLMLAISVLAL